MEHSPRRSALLVLLGVVWLLAPAGLVLAAVGESLTFFGELPTEAERARSGRLLVAAVLTAIAVALTGVVLAVRHRRPGAGTAFGVALAVTLVLAVPVLASVERVPPGSAIPVHQRGIGCQEHSGGDTRCPGG